MKRANLWLVASLLLLASPAFADTGNYDFGDIMVKYQTAASNYGQNITQTALHLSYTLFTIDLAWAILSNKILKGADIPDMLALLLPRIVWVGLVAWVISNPSIPLAFVNSFIQIGQQGAATSAISPSDVFWQGIDLVNMMMNSFSDNANVGGVPVPAGVAAMTNPFAAMLIALALITIVLCFGILTAQFAVAWIQLWFYLAVYPLVLAFGVTKWTKDIAMKIMTTPLVYGVRFMTIYFIIAVGTSITQDFGQQIASLSLSNLAPIWAILGGSILMLMLSLKLPTMASDLLGGTGSMSAGDGVAGVAAGAAGVAAVAGGAAALAGGAANSVAGAAKAGSAAIQASAASGNSGIGMAAGAIQEAGSAAGEMAMDSIKGLGSRSIGGELAHRINNRAAAVRENRAAGMPAPSVPGQVVATGASANPTEPVAGTTGLSEPSRGTPPAPQVDSQSLAAASAVSGAAAQSVHVGAPVGTPPTQAISSMFTHDGNGSQPSTTISAGAKAIDATKATLNTIKETSETGGGTIQISHGEE